jgi:hypothetical protein
MVIFLIDMVGAKRSIDWKYTHTTIATWFCVVLLCTKFQVILSNSEHAHLWRYLLDILVFCPDFSDSDTKIIPLVGRDWHFQCLSWNILEYLGTDGYFGCQICSKKYEFSYHSKK